MDRSIPHIRSIFTNSSSRKKSTSDTQDLCQYDKSPRSKRKTKEPPVDYYDEHELVITKATSSAIKSTSSSKKVGGKENHHLKSNNNSEEPRKSSSRGSGNYNTYTSKTLTERDMRHLERHLSMKKTIRKQISRNLAQAFLDNPDIFEPEDYKQDGHKNDHKLPEKRQDSYKNDHKLPEKRQDSHKNDHNSIEKPEQNVLDLLKISIEDSRDSGHSSPTLDDTDDDELDEGKRWKTAVETKGLVEERQKHYEPEKKSSSIWKMFRNKSKR